MDLNASNFAPAEDVIETDLDTELVLLRASDRRMYALNGTGRLLWRALTGEGFSAAVESLVRTYGIDRARARSDAERYTKRLLESGLLTATPEA